MLGLRKDVGEHGVAIARLRPLHGVFHVGEAIVGIVLESGGIDLRIKLGCPACLESRHMIFGTGVAPRVKRKLMIIGVAFMEYVQPLFDQFAGHLNA